MKTPTAFVPQLIIPNGVTDISFYSKAFNAVELWRLNNDDGTVHVAGFTIDDALFHIHEQTQATGISPEKAGGITTLTGLMVDDVHAVVDRAVAAGATLFSPVQDYDYGYRHGEVTDPFGHRWLIEKIINPDALLNLSK